MGRDSTHRALATIRDIQDIKRDIGECKKRINEMHSELCMYVLTGARVYEQD